MFFMEVMYERCCGIDVHKKIIVACLRIGRKNEVRQYNSNTKDLRDMTAWLKENDCQMIAMESTGSYWKPLYNIFELSELGVIVVNAQHMRNLPGRKTDVKDSEWIADLLQHGLLQPSYIPDREQRELREITRYRKSLVGERSREINRLQKFLEGANVKISSIVSDTNGVSSLKLIKTLVNKGHISKEEAKELVDPKMYKKLDDIVLAMDGVFSRLQKELILAVIDHIDDMNKRIDDLDKIMKNHLDKYEKAIQETDAIPGIAITSARTIIAEIGIDMSRFPTVGHICSWAGVSPGNNESAGKRKSGKTIKGNPTLKSTLIQCAVVASNQKGTFYHAQYQRIAARRGKNRPHVAVAHSMLISIYNMLKYGESYKELGNDYYNQFNKEKKIKNLLKRLNDLGWQSATA
jgi:transposase